MTLLFFAILVSCGGGEEKKEEEGIKLGSYKKEEPKKEIKTDLKASETIDLTNKGVGPIKNLELPETIDETMACCWS